MNILGIAAYYHDSAAAVVVNGEIVAAAQEEWFSRQKHDPSFPAQAVAWSMKYAGLDLEEIDAVAFYDKPILKFERLLETYYAYAPQGLSSFIASMPIWVKEKLFLKGALRKELKHLFPKAKVVPKLLFPEHHLSHAASAFYPSPFTESAILTIDGVGEWATATIAHGQGKQIDMLREMRFPHSLGLLYSSFTYFLGFRVNFGEYKLMGLAPYGNPDALEVNQFVKKIKEELIDLKADGSIWLNPSYFRYATGKRMIQNERWASLFGVTRRLPADAFSQTHCNLGLAIQRVTEEVVLRMAHTAQQLTGSKNLCLAGGVALNCVANGKLWRENIFEHIWIQPAAGDAGGAPGAALASHHLYFEQPRLTPSGQDQMNGTYLGPEFSDLDIRTTARKYKAPYQYYDQDEVLFNRIAELLAQAKVIGWYQGRQEFGPRALGNRSILGDPRDPDMQQKLNLKIKFREGFRPFAPSVLAEASAEYFALDTPSPYMLLVAPVCQHRQCELPPDYHERSSRDKLKWQRSDIPAVTHIDMSARVQTVHQETNPRYHALISAFQQRTGYGLLVNTSFNVRGEPVVCSPDDAYRCFIRTEMDFLVMGNFVFDKSQQADNAQTRLAKAEVFVQD